MPKREAFLQDQDLVRVLYPEDAWGAGAADVLEPVSYTHLTLPTIYSV